MPTPVSFPSHLSARMRGLVALLITLGALLLPAPPHAAAAGAALLVVEAEHPDQTIARDGFSWQPDTTVAGYAGQGAMQAVPATAYHFFGSDAPRTSPELRYAISLPADGPYSVWVRSNNPSRNGNSVYVGLDGALAAGLSTNSDGQWRWSQYTVDGQRAQLSAGAGSHTLNVWAREAGQRLDRILLTTDRSYVPVGLGPDGGDDDSGATPTPIPPAPTDNPAGCGPGELSVDAQDWWMPGEGQDGNDFGHIHTSLCFPHNKTVRGSLTLTIVSKMHHNPGTFYGLNVSSSHAVGPERQRCSDSGALACWRDRVNPRTLARCVATGGTLSDHNQTCTWHDRLTIDTRDFGSDGWKQLRVRAFVREPDGREQRTSTGLQILVQNGVSRQDYRGITYGVDSIEGRGWYGGDVNYTTATLEQPPRGPVQGIWEPRVHLDRGAEGIAVTGWYAALDTDFHNGNPGRALCPNGVRGQGETTRCGDGPFHGTLRIDTSTLANGWHRLFLKANARADALDSTNSGVLALWFEVRN